jgi:hypothetical protein
MRFTSGEAEAVTGVGSFMVMEVDAVSPILSVTMTMYVPAGRLLETEVVCGGVVFHEYPNGAVPPETVAVALPVGCL